jgi:hypothetical protein
MDPNLFHLDWERLLEVLTAVIVLSVFIERALAPLFESAFWLRQPVLVRARELVAFATAFLVCWYLHFDALSMIVLTERTHLIGELLTAAVVAGGSKVAVKLFHDVLGVRSHAYELFRQFGGLPPRDPQPVDPPPDEPTTLTGLMERARTALRDARVGWNRVKIESEIDPEREIDPFGTLERRWRISAARQAERVFHEMESEWSMLESAVERGLGVISAGRNHPGGSVGGSPRPGQARGHAGPVALPVAAHRGAREPWRVTPVV